MADGSLQTLKRNSEIYHRRLKRFLSPRQALRVMGWPMQESDRSSVGLDASWPLWPGVETKASLSRTDVRRFVGDAVNFHCMSLAIATVTLFAEKTKIDRDPF